MSVQHMAWAYGAKTGSPTQKSVLLCLANHANGHTGRCDPKLELVAEETELSLRAVKQAASDLCEKGLLARERTRRADGSLGSYRYSFPMMASAAPASPGAPPAPRPGAPPAPLEPEELQPEEDLATASRNGPGERPRDPIWDALVTIFGEPTTASARTLRGKIVRSLKLARASPDEILKRARAWPKHFDNATLTETALEKHWDALGRKPLRIGGNGG